jgi:PAS domain S-box-containing protein
MDSDAIVMTDPMGTIRLWSPGAEKAFGYSASQAIGETLDLIVPAQYRDAHWQGFRRAVEVGAAQLEGEAAPFPVQHADGSISDRTGRLTLIRQPQGRVVAVVVAFQSAGLNE